MTPIIDDPAVPNPAPPEKVTSPDGVLTGYRVDNGVLLVAQFPNQEKRWNLAPDVTEAANRGTGGSATVTVDETWFSSVPNSIKVSGGSGAAIAAYPMGTTGDWGFQPGRIYRASAVARFTTDIPTGSGPFISPGYRDSAGTIHYNDPPASEPAPLTAGEHRVSVSFTVPEDASTVFVRLRTGDAGQDVWWDDLLIEEVPSLDTPPATFFNGDTPDTDQTSYTWGDTGSFATPTYFVDKVRFTRDDTILVRSGNDAWAISGQAIAYDMEVPLGQTASWQATPIDRAGNLGTPSAGIGMATDVPVEPYNSWLRSITQPALSMRVFITQDTMPSWSYAARNNLSQVQGSPYPAGPWDRHMAAEVTLTAYTDPDVSQHQMLALLTSGPLLFQTDPDFDEPDFYALPGDIGRDLASNMANGARKWTIPLTVIDRPATFGAPLYVPGATFADTQQGSLARRQTVYPQLGDTLGVPL